MSFKIGVAVRNGQNMGSRELARELQMNFELLTKEHTDEYQQINRSCDNDQEIQLAMIDDLIKEEVDLLIVELVQSYAAATVIAKVKEADIPVIFINVQPLNDTDLKIWPGKTTFVGSDFNQSYLLLANYLNKQDDHGDRNHNGNLNYSWYVNDSTMMSEKQAENYPLNGNYPAILLDYEIMKKEEKARKAIYKNMLKADHYKAIDVIFCDDIQTAVEISALTEIKKSGKYILAFDLNPLDDNYSEIDALLLSDYPKQAAKAVEIADELCHEKIVKSYYMIDWLLKTKQ